MFVVNVELIVEYMIVLCFDSLVVFGVMVEVVKVKFYDYLRFVEMVSVVVRNDQLCCVFCFVVMNVVF